MLIVKVFYACRFLVMTRKEKFTINMAKKD